MVLEDVERGLSEETRLRHAKYPMERLLHELEGELIT